MNFQDEVLERYEAGDSFWHAAQAVIEAHGVIMTIQEMIALEEKR